jgi:hypothetical protein
MVQVRVAHAERRAWRAAAAAAGMQLSEYVRTAVRAAARDLDATGRGTP